MKEEDILIRKLVRVEPSGEGATVHTETLREPSGTSCSPTKPSVSLGLSSDPPSIDDGTDHTPSTQSGVYTQTPRHSPSSEDMKYIVWTSMLSHVS